MTRRKKPKHFAERLTISLAKKQRHGLARIARRRIRSVAFLVREAVDHYLAHGKSRAND